MIDVKSWLKDKYISYKDLGNNKYYIDDLGICLYIPFKEGRMFDDSLNILLSDEEERMCYEDDISHLIFQFGNNLFYSTLDVSNTFDLKHLRYVGKTTNDITYPYLGIHGKYDLMDGSFDYDLWCKKAKFLGFKTLGIVEKNTLAGTLPFQLACEKEGLESILGATFSIKYGVRDLFDIKIYALDEKGWSNLVAINSNVNVLEEGHFIKLEDLELYGEGLIGVIDPSSFELNGEIANTLYLTFEGRLYYQVDNLQYDNSSIDKRYLLNLQKFIHSKLKPVLINDSYYLDEEGDLLRRELNQLAGIDTLKTNSRHFRTFFDNHEVLSPLFKDEETYFSFMDKCVEGAFKIAEQCSFKIETKKRHLPKYPRKGNELTLYKSNEDMLLTLLEKGLQEKKESFLKEDPANQEIVHLWIKERRDRLDYEMDIIKQGGFVDYFLILYDIVQFCHKNDILTGLGRGSAAGSLVTYLLDLTKVDPLEYGLLFERFLNPGRIKKGLPDIDTDIDSLRRDEVKAYIEKRYGDDRVCSMGTYTTLQLKQALQDFSRNKKIPIPTVRYLSTVLDFDSNSPNWLDLMKEAAEKSFVKDFVVNNTDIVENIQMCVGQPKSPSVHACGMLILPEGQSIFNTIPIRIGQVHDQKMLVSEWEGEFLEKAGYLKEDILGITQLSKFQMIKDLVKESLNENVDIYNIPLDQEEVYELFRKGQSGDVFHLGSKGLTQYALQVQPENINDLIAMLALYRPGAMENNFHNEYVDRKFGRSEVTYDFMAKEITKETMGLYIYQEQIMQMCTVLGGFTLAEADDIRKAMGKKIQSLIDEAKPKFIQGAINNGCPQDEAEEIWNKLEKFAGYGFNKSHATCYAITGYTCQYLKWKYPIQFWTTAFEFAKETKIVDYIAECIEAETVKIVPVDINKSKIKFSSSHKENEIYWSISKVKHCGEVATEAILEERSVNGEFFSFEEFLSRIGTAKVNKLVVENLIFAGAFDDLENIKKPIDRLKLLNKYREIRPIGKRPSKRDIKIQSSIDNGMVTCEWWWMLFQKQVSGYAFFDYRSLIFEGSDMWADYEYLPLNEVNLLEWPSYADEESEYVFGGVIQEIDIRTDSKGKEFCRILLENNYNSTWFYIRREENWKKYKDYITSAGKGNLFIGNGNPIYNKWMDTNVIQSVSDFDCEVLCLFEGGNEDVFEAYDDRVSQYVEELDRISCEI